MKSQTKVEQRLFFDNHVWRSMRSSADAKGGRWMFTMAPNKDRL